MRNSEQVSGDRGPAPTGEVVSFYAEKKWREVAQVVEKRRLCRILTPNEELLLLLAERQDPKRFQRLCQHS